MSNLNDRLLFWRIIDRHRAKDLELYEAIKAEPELAPKSKKLGVRSLTFSLIFMFVIAAAVGGIALILNFYIENHVIFGILLIILCVVVAFYTTIVLYIRAFRLMLLQFRLNKTAISWVAMVFSLLPTLIVIVMVIIFISLWVVN